MNWGHSGVYGKDMDEGSLDVFFGALINCVVVFAVLSLITPLTTHASTCSSLTPTVHGSYFTNYESDEYSSSGLLIQHFKLDPASAHDPSFRLSWQFFDDECAPPSFSWYPPRLDVTLPAGVTDWSVRFASSTQFDIWDDQDNTIIASSTIEQYPGYFSFSLSGQRYPSWITGQVFEGSSGKIQENGQPPVFTGTLQKDSACPTISGYYNVFDRSYEHAEYVDHLLRVHLKFTSLAYSGQFMYSKTIAVPSSCDRDAINPYYIPRHGVTLPHNMKYFSFRMTTPTHWIMWDDETDTQITCSVDPDDSFDNGCQGDLDPSAPYIAFYIDIISNGFIVSTPYHPVEQGCTVNCNDNVMFLPGIESSRLYRPDYNGGTDQLWEPSGDVDAQDLRLNVDGTSRRADVYTKDVVDEAYAPGVGTNIYKSFISKMKALKTAGTIEDWAPIPYDWRLSLDDILTYGNQLPDSRLYYSGDLRATSTPYVIQELQRLARTSRTGKVTIVAHSNGGLLAKALMIKLGPDASKYIDKIIFVAVPQVGTPMAVAGLLHGYKQSIPFTLSDSASRDLGNNSPSAYNLIPSSSYFTQVDDPVVTFNPSLLDWVSRYGSTVHSQERLHTFLTSAYGRVSADSSDTIDPVQLNDALLTQAEHLHAQLDAWTPPTGVQLIQIAGWGIPTTLSAINYEKQTKPTCDSSGFCTPPKPLSFTASTTIDGDGTVVVPSALWMSTTTGAVDYWVDLRQYNKDHPFQAALPVTRFEHARIIETEPILSFVSDQITNTPNSSYQYLSTAAPPSTDHRLRYELHSPLTLDVYDALGHHTGISTTTGQIEEQIPGTSYMQFGDVKYLFTDTSTTAHIVMNGYATSTFTFNVSELQGDMLMATTTFKDIPTTPHTTVTLDTASDITTVSPMHLDLMGDGSRVYDIAPKENDIVTLDTTPPEIQIAFSTSTPSTNSGQANTLAFVGIDDMGTTTIIATTAYPALKKNQKQYKGTATTTVTARDSSGNTTMLVYTEQLPSPAQRDTIILQALVYNGATTTLTSTKVSYKWRIKDGAYRLFASNLSTMSTTTESHYRPKKNVTILMSRPTDLDDDDNDDNSDVRLVRLKLPGMVVPYMRTDAEKIIIGY